MEAKLLGLIEEFGKGLTKYQYDQYVRKLRDYLVPYLERKYCNSDLEMLFTNEFTRSDIIKSTLYYIEKNENVQRISAIDDFLIALNRFFVGLILTRYNNQNVRNLVPFAGLNNSINETLISRGIHLLEKETYPPIDENQYLYVIDYLKTPSGKRLRAYQAPIIIKLMLLYGFSHDRIADLKTSNYDIDRNILKVANPKDIRHEFNLELPYSLKFDFEKLFKFRLTKPKLNAKYLFINENNNKIVNGFVKPLLDDIRDKFENDNEVIFDERNPFTATGLQKYAIIKMIDGGVNQAIISEFTGQEKDILEDCQLKVNEDNINGRNRYINHKIRGIKTYDEL